MRSPRKASIPGSDAPRNDLKRADWRFLLPAPPGGCFEHLVLLGGPSWLGDFVVEVGIAARVSRQIPPKGSADALVLLDDAHVDLATASSSLSAGGSIYWEVRRQWNSILRTTPSAIRQRLLEAGLTPVAIYWTRPDFDRIAMYVPVGARNVLGWYADTFLEMKSFGRRAAKAFLKLVSSAGWGSIVMALAPRYAVTAAAAPAKRRPLKLAFEVPTESGDGSDSLPVVLLGGRDSTRRIVVFLLSPRARRPSGVLKFWRHADRNTRGEAEQSTLREIRSHLDVAMSESLPRPLGMVRWGGTLAAAETYAAGPPLSRLADSWGRPLRRKLEDLRLVFEWAGEFHRQAQVSRSRWDHSSQQKWVEQPVSNYQSAFGRRPAEERLFSEIRQQASALQGVPLPIVWAHPDLTGANVHRFGRRISVIDWSGASPSLPLFDLLYFALLWSRRVSGASSSDAGLDCFRELFVGRNAKDAIAQTVRESIDRYMATLEIDFRFFPILTTLCWVERSVGCFDRAQAVARGDPGVNPHPEELYVEYVGILAEPGAPLWEAGHASRSPRPDDGRDRLGLPSGRHKT